MITSRPAVLHFNKTRRPGTRPTLPPSIGASLAIQRITGALIELETAVPGSLARFETIVDTALAMRGTLAEREQ